MVLRKFYLITSMILSFFLFISGILILSHINMVSDPSSPLFSQNEGGLFGDVIENLKVTYKPFNVLLIGGDKVNKNADTMMLVNVNPAKPSVTVMSIPRDTKVVINGHTRKINYAYPAGGMNLAKKTVEQLLDVAIDHYVFIDTKAFREIIDILGGVEIYVPADLKYDDPAQDLHINLKKGKQKLNGLQAEHFVRFRKTNASLTPQQRKELNEFYDGSDLKRIDAQHYFIQQLIMQKANVLYLPKVNNIISAIYENLETDIKQNQIVSLIKNANNFKMENVKLMTLPGTPYDSSPWYYICNIKEAKELIRNYFSSNADASKNENTPQNTNKFEQKANSQSNAQDNKSSNKNNSSGSATSSPSNSKTKIKPTVAP